MEATGVISANRMKISSIYEIVSTPTSALLTMNMLEKIQYQLEHLSKSERKVAEVILASPAQAIHSSIAALAQEAGVSEPTVNRFCRSLETRGFPDFKLHLAQSLANGTPYVNRNVDEDDSVDAYTAKIFESAMASLDHVRQSLDMSSVNRAVDLLTQAKRIETPPRLSYREEMEARRRSERVVEDARALEARQSAERAARERRQEAERAAEFAAQQRQARQESLREEQERWSVTQPVVRRYVPPIQVVPPRPVIKPPEPERPQPMRSYPFR